MLFFSNNIKRIPVLGHLLVKIKNSFSSKPSPVSGTGNSINSKGVLNDVTYDIIGNYNEIVIGTNTCINDTLIFIRGDHHKLVIGENCFMGKGELWMEDDHCSLIIHNHTTIEHAHLAVTEPHSKLEIHKDCMIAKQVEIRTGDSHSIIDMHTGKRINHAANVTLKEHVWVGAHAKILKGVTIGKNSVIATGSIVTSDIPPHSIAAGIPAKVIKTNTDWKRERIID